MMPTEREVGFAAVRSAARLCEAVRAELVIGAESDKLDKQDRSPVTVADFGAQAVVCRLIEERFPDHGIVAEEDSTLLREATSAHHLATVKRFVDAEIGVVDEPTILRLIDRGSGQPGARFWVLDPIDGTKGFLRQDQYAIALALIEHGQVMWGFLACPALPYAGGTGVIFVAQRYAGAECYTLEGTSLGRVQVSDVRNPAEARLAESVESAHTNRGLSAQLQAVFGVKGAPLRMDSQAKYAAVAWGKADIYLRSPNLRTPKYREWIWDHAAGWLIVEEAGGKVTDVYGQPLDWTYGRRLEHNVGIVASNGHLHETIIGALAPMLPAR